MRTKAKTEQIILKLRGGQYYIWLILLLLACYNTPCTAENGPTSNIHKIEWTELESNLFFGRMELNNSTQLFQSQLYLLKFSLENFKIRIAISKNLTNKPTDSVENLVKKSGAIAGINASFFDQNLKPLGLIIDSDNKIVGNVQYGGRLLTGIFQIKDGIPSIVHRSDFNSNGVTLALQAGPRIISNGKNVEFKDQEIFTRRTGIALTSKNEIILYATVLRFPGASFSTIQTALANSGMNVVEALNLDGGGSSQFFINAKFKNSDSISASGGDEIPVALLVQANK